MQKSDEEYLKERELHYKKLGLKIIDSKKILENRNIFRAMQFFIFGMVIGLFFGVIMILMDLSLKC